MKDAQDPMQVFRLDGKDCFAEIMLSGLHFDKVCINFLAYNKTAAPGQRAKGNVGIFMNVYEALVLSRDIMSGRIKKEGIKARTEQEAKGRKFAEPVYVQQGGSSSHRTGGAPIARQFEITPGNDKPWVLCAKQGKAHETPEGLIVMDGMPEITIRVPCTDQKLKEFALAIETAVRIWEQLRFLPVAAPAMQAAQDKRKEAIDKAKASASSGTC